MNIRRPISQAGTSDPRFPFRPSLPASSAMAAPGPSSRSRTQKTADEPGGLPEPVNKKQKDERLARRIEENTARYATFKAALGNIDELVDEERARKRDPVLALLLDRQYEDRKRRQDAIDAAAGGTDLELVLAAYFQGRLHFGFEDEPIEEVVWQDPAFAANLEKMVPALAELIRKPFTTDPANLPGVKLVGKLDVSSIGGMFPTESEFEADFEQAAPIDPDGLEAADVDDRDGDASETPNTGNEPLPPSDEHGLHIYLRCLPYGGADDLIHDQKRTAFLFPGTQPRVFPKIATLNALLHAADGAPFPVFDIYVGISWGRGKDASVVRARKELVAIKKGELMTTNARFMQARERGSNELLIYEWVDLAFNPSLKKAHHRAREKDRNGQLCERLAIGCLWDSTENSADGGFLAGKARLSDDLKEVREGVARWEASQGVDGWDDGGAANPRIQAEVRELFRLLAAVLKWFPKADVGPEMDSVCLEAAIERAAWVPTFCGFVIKYLMHKDVPRESHQDPALAGFQRQDGMVGRGGHEFECNARFANPAIPDPPRRTGFGPNAVQYNLWLAVYFGPMVDFWSIILKHVLIWIVIIIKVRLLQIVRPLILVTHSSKISELVREGYFKSIFDVSNPAVKRFICDGEVPTSREDMAKLVIVVIVITIVWRELPMSKWIDHVGTIAIVPIGPFANSTALNVAALDSGVIKYDPAHGPLYREVEIATNLIINILMTVIKRMIKDGDRPDQDDAEQLHDWQLRAKAEAERAIEQLGVGKVLKDKIDELKMLQTWYFSNRNASAAWRSDFAKVEAGASVAEVTIERSNRQTVIARGWLEKSRFARGLPGSDERKQQAEELFGEAKERDRNGLPPPRWMPKAWAGKLENIVPWIMRLAAEGDNINMSGRLC